jgi:HEAT repeat protein
VTALQDGCPNVRIASARTLGEARSRRAVEPLIELLNDGNPAVRGATAWALGEFGDSRAVPAIVGMTLEEKTIETAGIRGLEALAKLRHAGAEQALHRYRRLRADWEAWWAREKVRLLKNE